MGEFTSLQTSSIALIKQKGRPVKILIPIPGTPADATKPWNQGRATIKEASCVAVVADEKQPAGSEGISDKICVIPGDLVDDTDGDPVVVDLKMRALVGDYEYAIVAMLADINPDGATQICWKVRLRRCPATSQPQQTKF